MSRKNPNMEKLHKRDQLFVEHIRRETVCARCGKQPIEWHSPEHDGHPERRIGVMVGKVRSIAAIQAELERCVPLCRSCHMREDGRLERLRENQPRQPGMTFPPKFCSECCRPYKPLRRGRCSRCDQRKRYYDKKEVADGCA